MCVCVWVCVSVCECVWVCVSVCVGVGGGGCVGVIWSGNTKGGSITVLLTSCLTGLDKSVLQIKTKIVSCHTIDAKPVKGEVNGTVILPPLVFPEYDRS
jgi:hypothetical protein